MPCLILVWWPRHDRCGGGDGLEKSPRTALVSGGDPAPVLQSPTYLNPVAASVEASVLSERLATRLPPRGYRRCGCQSREGPARMPRLTFLPRPGDPSPDPRFNSDRARSSPASGCTPDRQTGKRTTLPYSSCTGSRGGDLIIRYKPSYVTAPRVVLIEAGHRRGRFRRRRPIFRRMAYCRSQPLPMISPGAVTLRDLRRRSASRRALRRPTRASGPRGGSIRGTGWIP